MEEYIYRQTRDAAWQILLRVNAQEFPIKLTPVCELLDIRLCSYETSIDILQKMQILHVAKQTEAFIYHSDDTGSRIIFYDNNIPAPCQRVVIAHELGHIVLGHVVRGNCTLWNHEPEKSDTLDEQSANAFAARLLAPACVLHFARITTTEKIEQICQISNQFAQYRAERLSTLEQRNADWCNQNSKSYFFRNSMEEEVYQQFKNYINLINPAYQTDGA